MIKSFVVGLLIGGTSGLLAMHYHVVRTPERVLLVSRVHQPPLRSIYVDARSWNPARWQQYPELSEAMVKAGYEEILARDTQRESQHQVLPAGAQPERYQQYNAIPQLNPQSIPYQRHPPTARITTEVAAVDVAPMAIATPIPDGVGVPATKLIPRTASRRTPAPQVAKPVPEVLPETATAVREAAEPDSTAPTEKQNWMKSLFDSILPSKDSASNNKMPENLQALLKRVEAESLIAARREEQRILAANKPIEAQTVAPATTPAPRQTQPEAPGTGTMPQVAMTIPEAPPACKPVLPVIPTSSPLKELVPTLARPAIEPFSANNVHGQPTVVAEADLYFPAAPRRIDSQTK